MGGNFFNLHELFSSLLPLQEFFPGQLPFSNSPALFLFIFLGFFLGGGGNGGIGASPQHDYFILGGGGGEIGGGN